MQTDNNDNSSDRNPENNPSKAMDSKGEVENSNDNKTDQDFPGYPHYPAREDIMDQRNDITRENLDVENLPNSRNNTGVNQRFLTGEDRGRTEGSSPDSLDGEDDLNLKAGTEADVSADEVKGLEDMAYMSSDELNLRKARLDSTDLEGDELNEASFGDERDGSDLDIPKSKNEDGSTSGQDDEENDYYSLGGDRHEAQEEDPFSAPNRDID